MSSELELIEAKNVEDTIAELRTEIEILKVRLQWANEAKQLKAREYERRLMELNDAHAEQVERNAMYVSREAFEMAHNASEAKDDARFRELEVRFRLLERWMWLSVGAGITSG